MHRKNQTNTYMSSYNLIPQLRHCWSLSVIDSDVRKFITVQCWGIYDANQTCPFTRIHAHTHVHTAGFRGFFKPIEWATKAKKSFADWIPQNAFRRNETISSIQKKNREFRLNTHPNYSYTQKYNLTTDFQIYCFQAKQTQSRVKSDYRINRYYIFSFFLFFSSIFHWVIENMECNSILTWFMKWIFLSRINVKSDGTFLK